MTVRWTVRAATGVRRNELDRRRRDGGIAFGTQQGPTDNPPVMLRMPAPFTQGGLFQYTIHISKLQEQIQCQGQQGKVPVIPAVSCHKKKQNDHQKIFCIQIHRKKILQKASCAFLAGLLRRTRSGWLRTVHRRRSRIGAHRRLRRPWWRRRCRFRDPAAMEASIMLGHITVIHRDYLLPSNVEARVAIFAARMAFSSFAVLSLLM